MVAPRHGAAETAVTLPAVPRSCAGTVDRVRSVYVPFASRTRIEYAPVTITKSPPKARVYGGEGKKVELT